MTKEKQIIFQLNNKFGEGNENVQIVKSALEKQIPKKPKTETINRGVDITGEYDIESNYICPCCPTVVGDYETEDHYGNYCYNCGQALDWSDTE